MLATSLTFSPLQLLVVVTDSWESMQGDLRLYEREHETSAWLYTGKQYPVVLGENGLGWGLGLLPSPEYENPVKAEGDGKSPAGLFSLGTVFGFPTREEMVLLKMDYLSLDEHCEAVDDPESIYYNQIVSTQFLDAAAIDWGSSEKMREEPLYALGMVVNHNFPFPMPRRGSAIFFHIWQSENQGTAGCTAMSRESLMELLFWLDKTKKPVLVQLPRDSYEHWQQLWDLPLLISTNLRL
jgi:D-alanyl-D-alanine dipeptidase